MAAAAVASWVAAVGGVAEMRAGGVGGSIGSNRHHYRRLCGWAVGMVSVAVVVAAVAVAVVVLEAAVGAEVVAAAVMCWLCWWLQN